MNHVSGNRWHPNSNELATTILVKQLAGYFFKHLIVEEGQQVLFSADGERLPAQGAGRYAVHDLGDKLMQALGLRSVERMQALMFNCTAFPLHFELDSIFTTDPYRVGMSLTLSLQIMQPERCYDQLMRGQERLTTENVHDFLRNEIQNTVQEWVGSRSLQMLVVDYENKRDLFDFCGDVLRPTLESVGLSLLQVRSFDYCVLHRDELNGIREAYLIRATAAESELEGEIKLFELLNEQEKLTLRRESAAVEQFEQRSAIRERMRRAVQHDDFAQLTSEQEKVRFLRTIDRHDWLDADEWERLKHEVLRKSAEEKAQIGTDQAMADRRRAHLLARLDIEQQADLQNQQLQAQMGHEPDRLAHEQAMARQRLEATHAVLAAKQTFELAQRHQRVTFEQAQKRQALQLEQAQQAIDRLAQRKHKLADAQSAQQIALIQTESWAERERIRLEIKAAKSELGAINLERINAIKRRDAHERRLSELEQAARKLDMQLRAQQQQFAQTLAQAQQQQQHDLAWIASIQGLSTEALIVVARDPERAAFLHDLKVTEAMQGLSDMQILAKLAGGSAEAARALTEIQRVQIDGQLAVEQKQLYERLFDQQSAENQRLNAQFAVQNQDRQAERDSITRLLDTQLRGMAQIEQAKRDPMENTQSVWPRASRANARPNIRCPYCHQTNDHDAAFCMKCGQPVA